MILLHHTNKICIFVCSIAFLPINTTFSDFDLYFVKIATLQIIWCSYTSINKHFCWDIRFSDPKIELFFKQNRDNIYIIIYIWSVPRSVFSSMSRTMLLKRFKIITSNSNLTSCILQRVKWDCLTIGLYWLVLWFLFRMMTPSQDPSSLLPWWFFSLSCDAWPVSKCFKQLVIRLWVLTREHIGHSVFSA